MLDWVAHSVDIDHMPHSVVSDLGLHCLLRPACPNALGYYVRFRILHVRDITTARIYS